MKIFQLLAILLLATCAHAASPSFQQLTNAPGVDGLIATTAARAGLASNVVSFGIGSTNLNNTNWLTIQASKLDETLGYNRRGLGHSRDNISSGKPLYIEIDTTGLGQLGLFNTTWQLLTNYFCKTLQGSKSEAFPYYYHLGGTALNPSGKDTNWFSSYLTFNSANSQTNVPFVCQVPFNVFKFDFIAWTNGGSYQVYTNTSHDGSGSYVAMGSPFSTTNATYQVKTFFITNSSVFDFIGAQQQTCVFDIRLLGGGTNVLLNSGIWNNQASNCLYVGYNGASSATTSNWMQMSSNHIGMVWSNDPPDLFIWQDIEVPANQLFTTNFVRWISEMTNYAPRADIILCGTYPTFNNSGGSIQTQNLVVRTNAVMWANAGFSVSYFDGFNSLVDTNTVIARGFMIPANDPHYETSGYNAYGYLFFRWLDFINTEPKPQIGIALIDPITSLTTNILIACSSQKNINYYFINTKSNVLVNAFSGSGFGAATLEVYGPVLVGWPTNVQTFNANGLTVVGTNYWFTGTNRTVVSFLASPSFTSGVYTNLTASWNAN